MYFFTKKGILQQKRPGKYLNIGQSCRFEMKKKREKR